MEGILIALITAAIPAVTSLISGIMTRRANEKHAAKQSILQMILEDRMAVQEGRLPTNYQNVLHEFDVYTADNGNSYVHEKVDEYKLWFLRVQSDHMKGGN